MTLRDIIKDLCKKRNISINRVEIDLGFARGYISKLDKSVPNSAKLQKIADYFNVSLDYLMSGKDLELNSHTNVNDSQEISQFLSDNPIHKELFEMTKVFKKEDIEFLKQMVEKIAGNRNN